MSKPTRYQQILQQEVTRKQFIQVMVLAVASIMGFSNLLNLLVGAGKRGKQTAETEGRHGFGSSRFGV